MDHFHYRAGQLYCEQVNLDDLAARVGTPAYIYSRRTFEEHYEAYHFIWPTRVSPMHVPPRRSEPMDLPGLSICDVVGPICESADYLAKGRALPPVARGDLLCVFTAGAYGMVMASQYNAMPRPPEVLVDGDTARLIRRRERYEDLDAAERDPQTV